LTASAAFMFLLLSFAVYRLALIMASDSISASLRKGIGRLGATQFRYSLVNKFIELFYELITCPYCLGVWFAALAAWYYVTQFDSFNWLLMWLAIAGGQAFLQTVGGYISNEY